MKSTILSILIIVAPVFATLQSQDRIIVGSLNITTSEVRLTQQDLLFRQFEDDLSKTAVISDLSHTAYPDKSEVFLSWRVKGDERNILCIGLILEVNDLGELYINSKTGIKYKFKCIGVEGCLTCNPNPNVCQCTSGSPEGYCAMEVEVELDLRN